MPTYGIPKEQDLSIWYSRERLKAHVTKLFCPVCKNVQSVLDFAPLAKMVKLQCGHRRAL